MKITLAGKFETALIRSVDEVLQPGRNVSTHEYYAGLNRKVTSNYFDRCGTFLVLADETLVPTVDWNYGYDKKYRGALADVQLDINHTETGGGEWDRETTKFVEHLLKVRALSRSSIAYISTLPVGHYPPDAREHMEENLKRYEAAAARHYLCRLFLQLKSAHDLSSFVVLSEDDVRIIEEVGKFIVEHRIVAPFYIPDLRGKLIEPESFAGGLLNFAPTDLRAVSAVRSDKEIRSYSEKIKSLLQNESSEETERKMLSAMVEAHEKAIAGEKAEKIFEVASWLVKPLHYIPGVDAAMSIAEDIKDVGMKVFAHEVAKKEWHMIAVKMTDIALRDYLARKSNMLGRSGG